MFYFELFYLKDWSYCSAFDRSLAAMVNPWEKMSELADLEITVEDMKIKSHKSILASRSPVFLSMFQNDMKEKLDNKLKIEDTDKTTFSDFLHHLYEPHMDMDATKFTTKLLAVACKYMVESLLDKFVQNFENFITVENTFETAFHIVETDSFRLIFNICHCWRTTSFIILKQYASIQIIFNCMNHLSWHVL